MRPFVRNKRQVWNLYNLASQFGQRPSTFLKLSDPWTAYQLDSAVLHLGRRIESRLQDPNNKTTLAELLAEVPSVARPSGMRNFVAPSASAYRALANLATRKVTFKPDGTWD